MASTDTATTRTPLTRDRILATAVDLADTEGLGAVSMRKLARSLGVEAMSLYHHVANKDALLDGMVDAVFAEIDAPAAGQPWRPALRQRCTSARAVLRRHPWAVGLLDSRPNSGPHTLEHHDAVLGCLRGGGMSVPLAAHAFAVIDAFVYGFVLQEVALPFEGEEELAEVAEGIAAQHELDQYPHLAELLARQVLQPGYAFAEEFDWGLDLVLDGLERAAAVEAQRSSA